MNVVMAEKLTFRRRVWNIVEVAKAGDLASRLFDVLILSLIILSTLAIILESVDTLFAQYKQLFIAFNIFSVIVFTIEYIGRLWSCVEEEEFRHPLWGRLRFAMRPLPLIDLLAILPFYLAMIGADLRFIRILRIFRILRLAKLARYSAALRMVGASFQRAWNELMITLFVIVVLVIMAACLLYMAEHEAQPEAFQDIPSTMWWAVITLTTVGYGDVYPITIMGRALTSIIAILGIGLLALPTAILGAAFVEEIEALKKKREQEEKEGAAKTSQPGVIIEESALTQDQPVASVNPARCPHCGEPLTAEYSRLVE